MIRLSNKVFLLFVFLIKFFKSWIAFDCTNLIFSFFSDEEIYSTLLLIGK